MAACMSVSNSTAISVFGPDIVIPDVETGPASEVSTVAATVTGEVKLDKAGPASCWFEWGTTKAFGERAAV